MRPSIGSDDLTPGYGVPNPANPQNPRAPAQVGSNILLGLFYLLAWQDGFRTFGWEKIMSCPEVILRECGGLVVK